MLLTMLTLLEETSSRYALSARSTEEREAGQNFQGIRIGSPRGVVEGGFSQRGVS